jgi:CrcB protein
MSWLLVLVGAAIGAPARYLLDAAVQRRHETVFPWGTWVVNMVASLILGLVVGVTHGEAGSAPFLLVGVGFCGTLSTYSTHAYETLRLAESGARLLAAAAVTVTLVGGLVAAAAGLWIGEALAR